ncbi:hypothetical protein GJ496_003575 [Pomphorhynchus laevis]|nr:hypothetical protein GJ496_003575 [Pomphorhynchus laevis]
MTKGVPSDLNKCCNCNSTSAKCVRCVCAQSGRTCFNCNARNCCNMDYVQPKPKGETSLDLGIKHQDRINNIDLSTLNARIQNTKNDTAIRSNDKITETEAGLRQQFMNEP